MITGYNSDIELDGKVFHVQTEDKGLDNPVVETLVYCGGQVVASVLTSYADLAESPDYTQDRILLRMQEQHKSLIADLERGNLEPEPVIRRQSIATGLDPDNLIEEYVEDWIDSSALIEPVHRALESDIEVIRARDTNPHKRGQKKKNATLLAIAIIGIGFYAAFELGRVSLLTTDTPNEASRAIPSDVEPRTTAPEYDSISMTAHGLETPLLGEAPAATSDPDLEAEPSSIPDEVPGPVAQPEPPLPVLPTAPIGRREPEPAPAASTEEHETPVPAGSGESGPPPTELPAPTMSAPNTTVREDIPDSPKLSEPIPEAAPIPAPVTGPFEVHEVDQPPTSIATQLPAYTEAGLRQARQGSVRMTVLVGTNGNVNAVRLVDEITDSDLNRAAITAILHWRFNPGMHRGQPARVWVPIRLDFSLIDNDLRSVVSVIHE